MKNVLLVIPPGIRANHGLDYALQRATREKAGLIALVTLDPKETARIASRLDSAFMGERVSDRIVEVLAREQHSRAEEMLAEIGARVRAAGLEFTPLIETGDASEVCGAVIRRHQVGCAVLVAEKRSWLTKLLSRSQTVQVPALAGCEFKIVEEDDCPETPRGA